MEVDIRDGLDIATRRFPLTYETHRTDVSRGDRFTRQRALVRHPKSDEERSDDLVDTTIRQLYPDIVVRKVKGKQHGPGSVRGSARKCPQSNYWHPTAQ